MSPQQHFEPFAWFVATTEKDRPSVRLILIDRKSFDLDAVRKYFVFTSEIALGEKNRVLRHRHSMIDRRGERLERRVQVSITGALPRGVERRNDRRHLHYQRREGRSGRQRFVQMENVELLVLQNANGSQRRRRIGCQRRNRTICGRRHGIPERRHERVRRSTVAWTENPNLVTLSPQFTGQTHHLTLHPTRNREAVRAQHAHAQPAGRVAIGHGVSSYRVGYRRGVAPSPPTLSLVASPGKRRAILELASRAEDLGFPAIACPSLGGALGLCVSLAHVTSSIRFYTAIQGIYGNSIGEIGALASHIHEVSNARFALGLGVSHEPMVRRTGATMGPPLSDMRNFVEALRSNARFSGELPPIYVAALRDRMLDLAVEIGDGALWANASFRHTSQQINRIPVDKLAEGFRVANMIPTVIDTDRSAAAAINRRTMTTYVRLPNYRNYWKAAGYVDEMNAIEKVLDEKRFDDLESTMSDAWLSDCTLFGDADTVLDGFERWKTIGVEPIAVMSSTSGGQAKAVGELFALYS